MRIHPAGRLNRVSTFLYIYYSSVKIKTKQNPPPTLPKVLCGGSHQLILDMPCSSLDTPCSSLYLEFPCPVGKHSALGHHHQEAFPSGHTQRWFLPPQKAIATFISDLIHLTVSSQYLLSTCYVPGTYTCE